MNKRSFKKKAAVGSAAFLAVLMLVSTIPSPAWAEPQTNFHLVANSRVTDRTVSPAVTHVLGVSGTGIVDGSQVSGGGSFFHFLFNVSAATGKPGPPPWQLVASGTWKAKRAISFKMIGTYGVIAAGVLEMEVDLLREVPSPAVIPAILKIICNLAPANLFNVGPDGSRLPEGFIGSIPGTDFVEGGKIGPFVPYDSGLTTYTMRPELVASLQSTVRDKDAQLSQAQQLSYALAGLAVLFLITTIVLVVRKRPTKA